MSSRPDVSARYELGEPTATGGTAELRPGYDRWTERKILLKRLLLPLTSGAASARPRMTALFEREYRTLASLAHPNIVEVYEHGFDADGPYYVMELLAGADLATLAPLPYREACRVARDVASALALLHARRLLHRDLRPQHVRLTRSGVAKLVSFEALSPFGKTSQFAGSMAFVAPECLRDVPLDARSDLYALGALLYWTITGKTVLDARTLEELPDALARPLAPPSAHVEGLPAALDALIVGLLQREPARRPQSAGEVIAALTTLAGLEPEANERKVAFSYLAHPPLVGRASVLTELRSALEHAIAGDGGLVLVDALAGEGRSALFDQLMSDAQASGATVLRASASATSGAHGVARSLLASAACSHPDYVANDNVLCAPSDTARVPIAHPTEVLERNAQVGEHLRALLLKLSELGPLVIQLDDAERADQESLGLLASMAEELPAYPILMVLGSASNASVSHAHEQLAKYAQRVRLHDLEESDVAELVSSLFGAGPHTANTARWLRRETGGHPGHCLDLLRLMVQRGLIRYERGSFSVPSELDDSLLRDARSQALSARLSGLSPEALRVVELLSVQRGALRVAQLVRASGLSTRVLLVARATRKPWPHHAQRRARGPAQRVPACAAT